LTRRTQRRHEGCGCAKETGQKEEKIQFESHDCVLASDKESEGYVVREMCSSTFSNESLMADVAGDGITTRRSDAVKEVAV
jgi:hypothetical protein